MKVLVADDSITVRKIAERQLTEAGFEVVLAASGEEAVSYLERERPDLVVSDVIMADRSGYDVCAYVRSHAQLASTPVLLISGIVDADVTRLAASCRADGILKKPFQGSALTEQVASLLAKRPSAAAALPMAGPSEAPRQDGPGAIGRVTELERLLAAERARSAELLDRLKKAEQLVSRIGGLYDALRDVVGPGGAADGAVR